MYRFGLKLWSINLNYIEEAIRLYKESFYSYIELFVLPDTYNEYCSEWLKLYQKYNIRFIIHAPHFSFGVNLADKDLYISNLQKIKDSFLFADLLDAEYVIIHPGTAGDIVESARQFKKINDQRVVVENKPYYAFKGEYICNGYSIDDIDYIMKEANVGFCFDIGHAICSANALKYVAYDFLKEFQKLNPVIYHLSDGDCKAIYDYHSPIGEGNYNFEEILRIIPENSKITLETNKKYDNSLVDFEEDVKRLDQYNL